MKSEINIKQIAYLCGCSIGTVSKALNNSSEISEETKNKIKKIATTYNYKPNNTAKALKSNKTGIIGLIVPEFSNVHCANIMEGIGDEATEKGYKLVIYQSKNRLAAKNKITSLLFDGSIDGLIMTTDERFAEKCEKDFIKKVLEGPLPSVKMDFSLFPEKDTSPLVSKTMGKEIFLELLQLIESSKKVKAS
ncbi:LacI family DNA-binding transcriptional regulator [Maribacter sp. 2210JD10-5]|uniref:LacI family DNA-binding transcriptional regulator n=1 Tax=Maribacter sp. 2210JD10-5 TaxID=3386272 RepID=UPI0039BCA035